MKLLYMLLFCKVAIAVMWMPLPACFSLHPVRMQLTG
jgi:hypothetical protein